MPDIGSLRPGSNVQIAYPDVPTNLVTRFNDLIANLDYASTHLNTSSGNVQTFMNQANGAVQNVTGISQGQATQTLVDTWYYTTFDGNQAHTNMSGVATHLRNPIGTLEQNAQAIKDGMATVQSLQASNGYVAQNQSSEIQQSMNNLTNALNNIGMALEGAAKLINTINTNMPLTCATGFTPGGFHPTFTNNSFNLTMVHMTGEAGGGSAASLQAIKKTFADPEEADAFIELLQSENANLDDVAALLQKGTTPDQILQWVSDGKNFNGASGLLNSGKATMAQVSQWIDAGLNPNYAQTLLNKGLNPSAIDYIAQNFTASEAARWGQAPKKPIADALRRWVNGTTRFNNDGTPFYNKLNKNTDTYPIPGRTVPHGIPTGSYTPFIEYMVANPKYPNLVGANRIVINKETGAIYYYDEHYESGILIPFSYINEILG